MAALRQPSAGRSALPTRQPQPAALPRLSTVVVPFAARGFWATSSGDACRAAVCCTATSTRRSETPALENRTDQYCDDFECTSSPAVEATVKSLAKDLTRVKWTPALFARDVTYTDGVRSFQGAAKYREPYIAGHISKPVVTITRMQMLDKGTAQIDWRLTGGFSATQVNASITTVIAMNLVTGRIVSHKDTWDTSKLAAPVSAMLNISRVTWAAKQASQDTSQEVNKKMSETMQSLDGEDQNSTIYSNPNDPTKFFQGGQNDNWNDYVSFATVAALLYLASRAFTELDKLN